MNFSVTDNQKDFMESTEPFLCYTGPPGCGKTFGLIKCAISRTGDKRYRALILSAHPKEIAHQININSEKHVAYSAHRRSFTFESGARIDVGSTNNTENYITQIRGSGYNFIGIDECRGLDPKILELLTILARPIDDITNQTVRATMRE